MFKYLLRIFRGLSLKRIAKCVNEVKKKSGRKSRNLILLDMIGCGIKYGAGFHDYLIFEYYNMKRKERKTYMTRVKNKRLHQLLNDPSKTNIFDYKNQFYAHFKDFIKRDFQDLSVVTDDDIKDFIKSREYIIAKPSLGECGKGIELIHIPDFSSIDEALAYIRKPENGFGVIEDRVEQHPELSRIYPYSINCMRIVTVYWKKQPHVLYAVFKTGNHKKFVDNMENGGYACHVDINTGVVVGPGHTSELDIVEEHPMTGVKFEGFKIPYFEEAKKLVMEASKVIPQVRYIGWDVAVTPNGPLIIEGNNYAAYDFPQLPDRSQKREGLLKQLQDLGIPV